MNQSKDQNSIEIKVEPEHSNQSQDLWNLSIKDVRDSFASITAIRYSQPIHLSGKLRSLTLTAHRSGHTIGGTIWSLRSPLHTVSSSSSSTLLYAPIFNHLKERHLDSAALLSSTEGGMTIGNGMSRPLVMMIGTERSLSKSIRKKDRDQILFNTIASTLRSSHSVFIPTDASARLIELIIMLDTLWTTSRLEPFPLCLVSQTGKDMITFLRSLTEWMAPLHPSESQLKSRARDEGPGGIALRLRNLRFFNSIEALERETPALQPKLILAVPLTMSYGFSRRLFTKHVGKPGNLVVLTSMGEKDSLTRWLADRNTSVSVELKRKVILEGEELEQFLEDKRRAKERRTKHEAMLIRSRRMIDEDDDSDRMSSSDEQESNSETETQEKNPSSTKKKRSTKLTQTKVATWDEFVDETETIAFDIYVKGSQRIKMFPFVDRRRKVDAYGEMLNVDEWLRRGDSVQENTMVKNENVGKKRKWEEGEEGEAVEIGSDPFEKGVEEPPHKFISETEDVKVVCKVLLIDLEGKADGRALQTIIPHINPKTVVLINGTSESHQEFISNVAAIPSFTTQIFSPKIGECSVIGHDTKSFSVRLSDELMSSVKLSKVEGFEVGYFTGILQVLDESSIPTLERLPSGLNNSTQLTRFHQRTSKSKEESENEESKVDVRHRLNELPITSSTIFIGEIKLIELKSYLNSNGIQADFTGEGILICGPILNRSNPTSTFMNQHQHQHPNQRKGGGQKISYELELEEMKKNGNEEKEMKVMVRKTSKGELSVEGSIGYNFFYIKDTIYNLHSRMSSTGK
ncbi:beta-lactamase-like protein [Melampsora americana]|nr:beta-lactamase-like protein [Melampsora americana]